MRRKNKPLLELLEEEVKGILGKPKIGSGRITTGERLKAIEAGAKILAIRHRITDGGDKDGAFFSSGKR